MRARYSFWRNLFMLQLLLITVVLVTISFSYCHDNLQQQITLAKLSQRIAVLQLTQKLTQKTLEQAQELKIKHEFFQQKKLRNSSYLLLLQHIANVIPDDCWLLKIAQRGELFVIDGISRNYAAMNTFVQKFKLHNRLKDIVLSNIIQQENGNFHFLMYVGWLLEKKHHDQ